MTRKKLAKWEKHILHSSDGDKTMSYCLNHFKKKLVHPIICRGKAFHAIHGLALVEGNSLAFVYLTHTHNKGVFCTTDTKTSALLDASRFLASLLSDPGKDEAIYQEPWNDQLN